ncbi:PP2C family protein-serine/threonine phosphatase [Fodinibius saliphilus]|uniref:PP2C family protein-serine/threonine phosphatase n=1 Tax=Fodinibius saliphilus TaxID=1920650 RepID=UPI00110990A8|nr:SpoIIE family protein phosphatase [Fodinibius saliphilus]
MRTHKIMVVDDEPDLQMLILQKFRSHIYNNDYEFHFAGNGVEALQLLNKEKGISLVLSDINMPEMDGLTLLQKLQENKSDALKTIIVSAYGDMKNIRKAMNLGAFDFITKPIDFKDLDRTIRRCLEEIGHEMETRKQKQYLHTMRQDLDMASRIQQNILPNNFPAYPERNEFSVYAEMHSAKEVGGDFYDYFLLDDNHLAFLIGDVSGKGMPAAIYMAVSRTMLKAIATQAGDPAECLSIVNRMLIPESDLTTFVTVFYGILNVRTGVVSYCNGGHNLPLWIKKNGTVVNLENTDGLLLGKIDYVNFQSKEIQLEAGDKLLLYTDGLTEAMNEREEFYGEDRLMHYVTSNHTLSDEMLLRCLIVDVFKFINKAHQGDDITQLVMEYCGT